MTLLCALASTSGAHRAIVGTNRSRTSRSFWPCASSSRRPALHLLQAANDDGASTSKGSVEPKAEPSSASPDPSKLSSPATSGLDSDEYLSVLWEQLKTDAKKSLGVEEARMLDTVQLKDLESGDWARKLADEQLGPVLSPLGVEEEPLDFFLDLVRITLFMQLITVGTMFYTAELLGGWDAGDAFRGAGGLALGYAMRPFFKVEQLLYPVYNWGLALFFPNAGYEIPNPSRANVQSTLNRVGILIAATFFVPQALLHWSVQDCTQLVVPMGFGLFLFDVVLMIALLLKLRML